MLSGDIDQNDTTDGNGVVPDATTDIAGANAFHVVTGSGVTTIALLDGFTITAGDIGDGDTIQGGGGMYNEGSSPSLANLTFSGNHAMIGGGMLNLAGSNPTLTNVTFSGNLGLAGGGMGNYISSPTLTDVIFSDNIALGGGGLFNIESNSILTNTTFVANEALERGGGIFNESGVLMLAGSRVITNSTIITDSTDTGDGGGIWNSGILHIMNSQVEGNVTANGNDSQGGKGGDGGGVYNLGTIVITTTSIVHNQTGDGGGVYNLGTIVITTTSIVHNQTGDGGFGFTSSGNGGAGGGVFNSGTLTITASLIRENHTGDGGPADPFGGAGEAAGGRCDMGAVEYMPPVISQDVAPASVREDGGVALTFTFTRTRNTLGVITATFDLDGTATFNTDYVQSGADRFDGSSGEIIFSDGQAIRTLLITPTANFLAEPDEAVMIMLTASTEYEPGSGGTVTSTIIDDDSAGVAVSSTVGLTTTEAGGSATFSMTLQSEPQGTVNVTTSGSDTTEGTVSPGTLTFSAGNWQTPQPVTVTGVDDEEVDGDVVFAIQFNVSSDDPDYDNIAVANVSVTNVDDDEPTVYMLYIPEYYTRSYVAPDGPPDANGELAP